VILLDIVVALTDADASRLFKRSSRATIETREQVLEFPLHCQLSALNSQIGNTNLHD